MNSIRKWLYRPKREDPSKLVQFYYADEELNLVATELDSFDGHKDPDRCSALVNQLRLCQDKVLNICNEIMDEAIPTLRANRDYRVKFPDEMLHENLAGQLWFGAECLAAGSNVANREEDSEEIRPLAKAVTKSLDDVRNLLRDQCLRNSQIYSDKLKESLEIFDRLFAEFELRYVRIMVPIKTLKECHLQQEIIVLFSETLQRALRINLFTQDMVDDCDPSLMFTVPRLAIVCGLIIYSDGPLNVDNGCSQMSYLFKPFYCTLYEIRELLWTLSPEELSILERTLCSTDDFHTVKTECAIASDYPGNKFQNYVNLFLQNHQNCQQFILDFYGCHVNTAQNNQNLVDSSNTTKTWQTEEENTRDKNCFSTNNSTLDNYNSDLHSTITFGCSDNEQNFVNSDIPNYSHVTFTETSNTAQCIYSENYCNNKTDTLSKLENSFSTTCTDSNSNDQFCNETNHIPEVNENITWSSSDVQYCERDDQLNNLYASSLSKDVPPYFDTNAQSRKNEYENYNLNDKNCKLKKEISRQENNPSSSKTIVASVSSQTDDSLNNTSSKLEREELLWTLSPEELSILERTLCSTDDFHTVKTECAIASDYPGNKFQNYVNLFLQNHQNCQQFILDFYGCHVNTAQNNQNLVDSSNTTKTWQTEEENTRDKNCFSTNNSTLDNYNSDLHSTITFGCSDNEQNFVNSDIPNYSHVTFTETSNTAQCIYSENYCNNKTDTLSKLENSFSTTCTDSNSNDQFCNETNHIPEVNENITWSSSDVQYCERDDQLNNLYASSLSKDVPPYFDTNAQSRKNEYENYNLNDKNCKLKKEISRQENNPSSSKTIVASVSSQTDDSLNNTSSKLERETEDRYNIMGYLEDEAIALALQTAEIASRNEVRSNYSTSEELIHKLFVAISEVADQLQTNCASDLRSILKSVFDMNSSHSNSIKEPTITFEENISEEILPNNESEREIQRTEEIPETSAVSVSTSEDDRLSVDSAEEAVPGLILQENQQNDLLSDLQIRQRTDNSEDPPRWVPDEVTKCCMACNAHFTLLRRRHHCRNCGKVSLLFTSRQ
ncbi:lateral signaling target protein 2 homolog [Centruroides sculpturatus]|uniref:lateral signaling target protein 2 homolog n=1 Tax=Centruroides sculpturatus TaxID=218467 RepID=UPI000C6E43A5|nr:lateral signaling target protein 2 homolog [Centruroides sculpturatus]